MSLGHTEQLNGLKLAPLSDFEKDLQSEIEVSAKKPNWDWLNLPITLWLFSAVGISLLGFAYQGYSSCTTERRADNLKFNRLFIELFQRRNRIGLLDSVNNSVADLKRVIETLDPDTTYIIKDFKGEKPIELALELNFIVDRWGLIPPPPPTSATDKASPAVKPAAFDLATDYWADKFRRFTADGGNISADLLFDAQAAKQDESRFTGVMDQIRSAASHAKNDSDITDFLDQTNLIHVNCFPRSLWRP